MLFASVRISEYKVFSHDKLNTHIDNPCIDLAEAFRRSDFVYQEEENGEIGGVGGAESGKESDDLPGVLPLAVESIALIENVRGNQTDCITGHVADLRGHPGQIHTGRNDAIAENGVEHSDNKKPRELVHDNCRTHLVFMPHMRRIKIRPYG
jgi:hypothetical protein